MQIKTQWDITVDLLEYFVFVVIVTIADAGND